MPSWQRMVRLVLAAATLWAGSSTLVHAQWHEIDIERWVSLQKLKERALAPQAHADAAFAHEIFSRLLRAWDSPRLAPTLYVIDAPEAVWAASLADGSVLITRKAVNIARSGDFPTARLAFVLAHELGHQQADHFWRQRYFRLSPAADSSPRSGSSSSAVADATLRDQERQADADGLVIMMLSGYDPLAVIGDSAFFDEWVASVQGRDCGAKGVPRDVSPACLEAQRRAKEAREQLAHVASQAALFELGIQAYAVADYGQALRYFAAFGRLFPAPAVHANLALTHLALALQIRRRLALHANSTAVLLDYPLVLSPNPLPEGSIVGRGLPISPTELRTLEQTLRKHVAAAIAGFEKVIQLRPADAVHYLHLAASHLLDMNVPMAKGVLDGRHAKQFAASPASLLLRGALAEAEGDREAAHQFTQQAIAWLQSDEAALDPQRESLLYVAYHNLSALLTAKGQSEAAMQAWEQLARWSDQRSLAVVFAAARGRTAIAKPPASAEQVFDQAGTANHPRLHVEALYQNRLSEGQSYGLWLEGERLSLYLLNDGTHVVVEGTKAIRSVWQRFFQAAADSPDTRRIVAKYGVPATVSAGVDRSYVWFASSALGFELDGQQAVGWFRYGRSDAE